MSRKIADFGPAGQALTAARAAGHNTGCEAASNRIGDFAPGAGWRGGLRVFLRVIFR
jgi:hypothetical protein